MIYNYAASTRPQNLCKISRPKLLGSICQISLLRSVIKWCSGEPVPRGTPFNLRKAVKRLSAYFSKIQKSECVVVREAEPTIEH